MVFCWRIKLWVLFYCTNKDENIYKCTNFKLKENTVLTRKSLQKPIGAVVSLWVLALTRHLKLYFSWCKNVMRPMAFPLLLYHVRYKPYIASVGTILMSLVRRDMVKTRTWHLTDSKPTPIKLMQLDRHDKFCRFLSM